MTEDRGRKKFACDGYLYVFSRLSEGDVPVNRLDDARMQFTPGMERWINPYSHFPLAANVEVERFVIVIKWWRVELKLFICACPT